MALARRSTCGLGRRCNQWLRVFLAKEALFPSSVGIAPHLEAGGAPFAGSSAGPLVFALMATALAWNLTDVAVLILIAIVYGGFLRTMEALTLQRSHKSQRTAHVFFKPFRSRKQVNKLRVSLSMISCSFLSIINRLLCMLSPSDYFLLSVLELGSFHFSPYSLRRGGATAHWMLCRNMDATIEKGRWSSVKTARIWLKESIAAHNSLSIPVQQLAYFDQLGQAMLNSLF